MARTPIITPYAQGTSNKDYPTDQQAISEGISYQGEIKSNQLNGALHQAQAAVRDLQLEGAFYDNNQSYKKYGSVHVLANEGDRIRVRRYLCLQDTTGRPPLNGDRNDTSIAERPIYGGNLDEPNPAYWRRLEVSNTQTIGASLDSNRTRALFQATQGVVPRGTLRVRLLQANTIKVAFEIVWGGVGLEQFKIQNVFYSSDLKLNPAYTNWDNLFYSGCGIVVGSSYLGIARAGGNLNRIEVDFDGVNFTPSLTNLSLIVNGTDKPYAIREGGGSDIAELGCIFDGLRFGSGGSDECYTFWKFRNGFVEWTSSKNLHTELYHQYIRGSYARLNQDPSDKYRANVGALNSQTEGVSKNQSLPNVEGGLQVSGQLGTYSSIGLLNKGQDVGVTGPFYSDGTDTRWHVEYAERYRARGVRFSLSRANSIYKTGASVQTNRIVVKWYVRAF